ncbi:MAG: hypothetical protein FWD78_08615 [Treponema sp.]|nr:hypothetical protein [Treponema sp.]
MILLCGSGCSTAPGATGNIARKYPAETFFILPNPVFPEVMYYGVNLGYFPQKARDWIINEAFPKAEMEQPFMVNLELKVWWAKDNNAVLAEVTYTIAKGYVGAGKLTTGSQGSYGGDSQIINHYGKYAYYHTLRYKYEYSLYSQKLSETDPAFAEIIVFAKQLCSEIEYDWGNFPAYKGAPAIPTPDLKHYVCDGYAEEVMQNAIKLSSVQAVQKWTGPNHAWNVLKLTDGRTLFFDLTWFDNEYINSETGEIYQTDDYNWENITFNEHLFRFSGVSYGTLQFTHNLGTLDSEIRK